MRRVTHYEPGDRVEILHGIHMGQTAKVLEVFRNRRVCVLLDPFKIQSSIRREWLRHTDAVTALARLT